MSGMFTRGGMVGWKGAMPKSSHHRGPSRCQEKGKKEWSDGAPAARSCRHTMSQWGGGIHKVIGGVHLDVGVLGLPRRVSTHGIEQLVNGGGLRGHMQKLKRGELGAEFPPQSCGPGLPPKIGVAGGAAQVDVNDLGGGVEGCCPAHNFVHPQCPRQVGQVGRLLQLVLGDGEGLVLRQSVGSRIGAGLQGGELGQSLLGHGHKKKQRKALRAVRKRNSGNWGKFV